MQEKIERLNDPIAVKYEKDGLVQTYKKRLEGVEEYVTSLEQQLAESRVTNMNNIPSMVKNSVDERMLSSRQPTDPPNPYHREVTFYKDTQEDFLGQNQFSEFS